MKVLFSVNHFGFLRNFESALRRLAERGHRIHLLAERRDSLGGTKTIDNLEAACPGAFSWSYLPSRADDGFQLLAVKMRLCLDYWRYLDARYDQAPSLRSRAAQRAPAIAIRLTTLPLLRSRMGLRILRMLFRRLERALPRSRVPGETLDDQRPDVLLLTPLLYFGSPQVDYVRAARERGIPSVHCVGSWDHLTTKGMIHEIPDRVTVWNEAQRQEASELHSVPPDRVAVTGAQAYDHWFTAQPSTSRETFCGRMGVDPLRPIVLYLCSSPFIAPHEVPFVRRWIEAIRACVEVADIGLLIRPHPQNAEQWRDVDLSTYPNVGIWPRAGANPVDAAARADYFDSMYHSAAVVGVNTSALIESGIVGRPVCAINTADFTATQDGTLHFQHLKNVNGGLLHLAPTLEVHLQQLAQILADPAGYAVRSRAFIEGFVRPNGLATPAAEQFVRVIEAMPGTVRPHPASRGAVNRVVTRVLRPVARAVEQQAARSKAERKRRDRGGAAAQAGQA